MNCRKDSQKQFAFLAPGLTWMEDVPQTRRHGSKKHEKSGARSKSNYLCSELVCGQEHESFRRPLLRHFCLEQRYVRLPERDIEKYRQFLGGVIRYISYNKATGEGTMRRMQGNTTTTDLRLKAGLEDVQTQIIQATSQVHWTCREVQRHQNRTSSSRHQFG